MTTSTSAICVAGTELVTIYISILNEKNANMNKIWIRNAGKFGIAKTSLFTKIINLKKMSKAIRQFALINGTWKEV